MTNEHTQAKSRCCPNCAIRCRCPDPKQHGHEDKCANAACGCHKVPEQAKSKCCERCCNPNDGMGGLCIFKHCLCHAKVPEQAKSRGNDETHTACDKILTQEGAKASCCYCVPHDGCELAKAPEQALDKLIEESEKLGLYDAPEQAKDWFGKWMETKAAYPKLFDKLTIELVEEIFAQLLAERDAETEKRVRAEIDKGVKKIDWLQLDEDGHTILISKAAALKVIRGNEPTV